MHRCVVVDDDDVDGDNNSNSEMKKNKMLTMKSILRVENALTSCWWICCVLGQSKISSYFFLSVSLFGYFSQQIVTYYKYLYTKKTYFLQALFSVVIDAIAKKEKYENGMWKRRRIIVKNDDDGQENDSNNKQHK